MPDCARRFAPLVTPEPAPPDAGLIEVLRLRAAAQAEQTAFVFLEGEQECQLRYGELDRRARAIAASLRRQAGAGDRAILLYPPGIEFISAFIGCLYAGVAAVPVYPPDPRALQKSLPRLRGIVHDAEPAALLTTRQIEGVRGVLEQHAPDLPRLPWIATDAIDAAEAESWQPGAHDPGALAFLQYTSGSTADPKGVMVSHANLVDNLRLIQNACEGDPVADLSLLWLPTYHDMGLIGGALLPLYGGGTSMLMSPLQFLRKPLDWLRAMSRYHATVSGAPNFAFDLCVRRSTPAEREGLDLSAWRMTFCGGEPIRAETVERFHAEFAPYGLRPEVLYPCYGLAEATLMVTGGDWRAAPVVGRFDRTCLEQGRAVPAASGGADALRLLGCGRARGAQRVAIVDPDTRARLPDGQVGEIWVHGPSVALGYWRRESESSFAARIRGESLPFLRTGDLGFLADGELFVTGRIKDLIILRGRNILPQDLEASVERACPQLRPGCGAAFTLEAEGEERLVIAFEVMDEAEAVPDALADAVRDVIADEHGLALWDVVFVKPRSIPKTSSGKIRRNQTREDYRARRLDVVGSLAAA